MTQTPKRKLKAGDPVMLPSGLVTELTDIQYEHNRYQLLEAASGWQYGIDNLQPADWQTEARKWRREALREYPTPEAYEAACAARDKHSARADAAEARIKELENSARFELIRHIRTEADRKEYLLAEEIIRLEAREQRLKEAIDHALKWTWYSSEANMTEIDTVLSEVFCTLYPDTPAPKEGSDEV